MTDLKKPLTYDEQIDRLINVHKLLIRDRTAAKQILEKVNYYRLSAYGIGLKKFPDTEEYEDGVSLESLYRLYIFDSKFRNLLIHVIEQLEIQLRTQISNYLALKYGSEGYMEPSNFQTKFTKDGKNIHQNIIENFKTEVVRQRNLPFVKHHNDKYDGHFPIWVAVELFSFGNLASLFDIMNPEDQEAIASLYNTESNHLSSWVLALVEIRNICAHYSRLYNMPLKQAPYLYSEYKKYRQVKKNKVFPALITIKRMLKGNNLWDSFYISLESLVEEYCDVVRLSYMGFPPEWRDVLSN